MTKTSSPKWGLRIGLASLALLLLVVVIVQNTQVITLRFLFWQVEVSQILVIVISAISGFLVGLAVAQLLRGRDSQPGEPE